MTNFTSALFCLFLALGSAIAHPLKCDDILERFQGEGDNWKTYQINLREGGPRNLSFDIRAGLTKEGLLHLYLLTRDKNGNLTVPFTGSDAFQEIVNYFGESNIKGLVSNWGWGTNLEKFLELRSRRVPFKAAALQTWTGKKIAKLGLTRVEIASKYYEQKQLKSLIVLFTRPDSELYWRNIPEGSRGIDWFHE